MIPLSDAQRNALAQFALALVNQRQARVVIEPNQRASGFWFGGGNMVRTAADELFLVGRFRDAGDSRTGLQAGPRGRELAVFRSRDGGDSFEKCLSFSKSDLHCAGHDVLSIEGSALHLTPDGVELFVSTEKDSVGYPSGFEAFLKPGTGVWSIDRLQAASIDELSSAAVEPLLATREPNYLHIKDPFVDRLPDGGLELGFCTHPFSWTSSNTAYCRRPNDRADFSEPVFQCVPRGDSWDVAMTRTTAILDVPAIGLFEGLDCSLVFYDGGECVRNLDQHAAAVQRPRGYSCEELGGVGVRLGTDWDRFERLSRYEPMFVSPHGTGCSRYVDICETPDAFLTTWQQSQPDGSQPLVMNRLERAAAERILGGEG